MRRPPHATSTMRGRTCSPYQLTGRAAAERASDRDHCVPPSFLRVDSGGGYRPDAVARPAASFRAVPSVTADLVAAACARHLPGVTGIDALTRLSGGASRETWAFDATHADGTVDRLVLRRDPGATIGSTDRSTEYELVRAAGRAGVAVPAVRFLLDDDDDLGAGFVMARIDGETIPRKLL